MHRADRYRVDFRNRLPYLVLHLGYYLEIVQQTSHMLDLQADYELGLDQEYC